LLFISPAISGRNILKQKRSFIFDKKSLSEQTLPDSFGIDKGRPDLQKCCGIILFAILLVMPRPLFEERKALFGEPSRQN
jgi:hypothetical protein